MSHELPPPAPTVAQLGRRAAELKAFAAMAPTAQARAELNRLAKQCADLAAQQPVQERSCER